MDGIRFMLPGSTNYILYIQITVSGSCRTYQTGFIGIHDVFCCTVRFRIDSYCTYSHLFAGTHYTYSNLASIGNQYFFYHCSSVYHKGVHHIHP